METLLHVDQLPARIVYREEADCKGEGSALSVFSSQLTVHKLQGQGAARPALSLPVVS
jgi:hypothetical protein